MENVSDFVDTSGIRFYTSTKLKRMDAGVIELGLEYTDKMAIPPGEVSFPLTGYCTSACTAMVANVSSILKIVNVKFLFRVYHRKV